MEAGRIFDNEFDATPNLAALESRVKELERKISQQKIQREDLLSKFVLHMPAAVAMFDTEMRYLKVSKRWSEDFDLLEEKILGKSMYEVFPDIPQRWIDVHNRCLKGVTESCLEDKFIQRNGHIDYLNWVTTPWYKENGKQGGVILLTELITEQVEDKHKILELNKKLKQTNQEFEHLIDTISNKIEKPLNIIQELAHQIQDSSQHAELNTHIEELLKQITVIEVSLKSIKE